MHHRAYDKTTYPETRETRTEHGEACMEVETFEDAIIPRIEEISTALTYRKLHYKNRKTLRPNNLRQNGAQD